MTTAHTNADAPGVSPIRAGLTAGAAAAVCGSLLNLPLHSPSDAMLNSASVTAASLAAGVGAGLLWRALGGSTRRHFYFPAGMALAFALVAAAAAAGESQIERSASYVTPLAGLTIAVTAGLTQYLASACRALPMAVTIALVIAAFGVGGALAGVGDQESGKLELPPRSAPWSMGGVEPA